METTKEMSFNTENIIVRSPRLETVIMVEEFIKEKSGEFRKTELFQKLPKKVMWGTFNIILKYLYDNNKIAFDKEDHVVYIWSPELAKKFINKYILKSLNNFPKSYSLNIW